MTDILVAGERAETLLEALQLIEWQPRPNGMTSATACFEPRLGAPLARALMRIEAELLLADADTHGRPGTESRTHDQRAADALVALALRVADALNAAT
jgi:hypothetical protein